MVTDRNKKNNKFLKTLSTSVCLLSATTLASFADPAASDVAKPADTKAANSSTPNPVAANQEVAATEPIVKTFISHVTKDKDKYGYVSNLGPNNSIPDRTGKRPFITNEPYLVVYMHAMTSSYLEPFIATHHGASIVDAVLKTLPCAILSTNSGGPSTWGNDKSLQDVTDNIRDMLKMYPVEHIVFIGTSMGASLALNYAAVAPADIKDKLVGVVAVEPCGDLEELYYESATAHIQAALEEAFGGNPGSVPDVYKKASIMSRLDQLKEGLRFFIVSAMDDTTMPKKTQFELQIALRKHGFANKLVKIEGIHQFPASPIYIEGLKFALNYDPTQLKAKSTSSQPSATVKPASTAGSISGAQPAQ